MGVVFRAFDPMINRHVAIKVVRLPEDAGSADRRRAWSARRFWSDSPRYVRVSNRDRGEPSFRGYNIGFRCAGELR